MTEVHRHALHAAFAAEAAAFQDKFWEMHDSLFEDQDALEDEDLLEYAQRLGLDMDQLAQDFSSDEVDEVEQDFRSGVRNGVNGTPTFFINGVRYHGSYDYPSLLAAVQEELAPARRTPPGARQPARARQGIRVRGRLQWPTGIRKPNPLPARKRAPAFSLKTTPDQFISLADFKGRPVILLFYPADWSPVCSDELALFNQVLPEFRKYNAQPLGISVDSAWCHMAFAQNRNLHFPLLADFHPKGEVAEKYGVYLHNVGEADRALFVIDGKGVIRCSYLSPVGVSPGADGILNAPEELQKDNQAGKKRIPEKEMVEAL